MSKNNFEDTPNKTSEASIEVTLREHGVFRVTIDDFWEAQLNVRGLDWLAIIRDETIAIEGTGLVFEDKNHEDIWEFSGGLDGELLMRYWPQNERPVHKMTGYHGKPRSVLLDPLAEIKFSILKR